MATYYASGRKCNMENNNECFDLLLTNLFLMIINLTKFSYLVLLNRVLAYPPFFRLRNTSQKVVSNIPS